MAGFVGQGSDLVVLAGEVLELVGVNAVRARAVGAGSLAGRRHPVDPAAGHALLQRLDIFRAERRHGAEHRLHRLLGRVLHLHFLDDGRV